MDLKGSLGVNGDISRLNSNTDLEAYYIESDDSVISVGSGGSAVGLGDFELDSFTTKVTSPGTWTDMEVD